MKKIITKGQEVEVLVIELNTIERRIGLSVKQLQENPYEKLL